MVSSFKLASTEYSHTARQPGNARIGIKSDKKKPIIIKTKLITITAINISSIFPSSFHSKGKCSWMLSGFATTTSLSFTNNGRLNQAIILFHIFFPFPQKITCFFVTGIIYYNQVDILCPFGSPE
jgi:hypothetical protein